MPRLSALLAVCLLGLSMLASAAEMSTKQRLELLERRVSRITELTLQLEEMRRENRQLRGEIENLGYEIEQLKRKQRDLYLDIDQRLGAVQGGVAPSAAPADDAAATQAPVAAQDGRPRAAANVDRAQIQAEYQAAYDLLSPQQKQYRESARAFAAFLEKYPDDELAPNAQYWLGEAHYVSQQNDEALQAFEQVISRHPDSTKAPGALFKIGRLQQAAGRVDAARAAYERVLEDYPNSPAAGLSRQRLQQLGN
jgi:tol-pal system protein YbgF